MTSKIIGEFLFESVSFPNKKMIVSYDSEKESEIKTILENLDCDCVEDEHYILFELLNLELLRENLYVICYR